MQVYAFISAEEEIEQFYEDLTIAKNMKRTRFTVAIGDFNAKIEEKKTNPQNIGTLEIRDSGNYCLHSYAKEECSA